MQFLVDTNIWLELLLDQQRAQEVRRLLAERDGSDFAITEFSFYSIGIILTQLHKDEVFSRFIADVLYRAGARLVPAWTRLKWRTCSACEGGLDWTLMMRTSTQPLKSTALLC